MDYSGSDDSSTPWSSSSSLQSSSNVMTPHDRVLHSLSSSSIGKFVTLPRRAAQKMRWVRARNARIRQRSVIDLTLPLAAKTQIAWDEHENYHLIPQEFWDRMEIVRTDSTPNGPYVQIIQRTTQYLNIRGLYAADSPDAWSALLELVDPVAIISENEDYFVPSECWWRRVEDWIFAW
ncbi:hypothetical protein AAP_01834 [Ascosphaera apis ARSEF 7405]|uniref:Uncharacterized protein n=1 Tax=Ascosphaera apis ARSEF 7405 TaxID=392613 RepID=A0A168AYQ1_9EURO|nr:hypothetical protein AAP_01834 [Ascosphaera apis ARSEF 7405]